MKFIIFHGAFGSPEGNWFPQLKEQLETIDQKVTLPRFPVDNWDKVSKAGPKIDNKNQKLEKWFQVFENEVLKTIKKDDEICFIGHSLGPVFILHIVEKYNLQIDSAIFVSPFYRKLNRSWQIDHVNRTFYKEDFNWKKLKKLIPLSYVLYSDNDPYVDERYVIEFADRVGSEKILVTGGGHLNSEASLTQFPLIYELCKTRLKPSTINEL